MALNDYSASSFTVNVNGRIIDDWGVTDPPYTDDPIDPKSILRRGQGGNASRMDRSNPGRTVTLSLNPGGSDAAYMQGLMNSRANITLAYAQIGTGEGAVGTEGLIVNDGQTGRGGSTTLTDDQFILEFNAWTQTKGGS